LHPSRDIASGTGYCFASGPGYCLVLNFRLYSGWLHHVGPQRQIYSPGGMINVPRFSLLSAAVWLT